jgi:hypothetical protein
MKRYYMLCAVGVNVFTTISMLIGACSVGDALIVYAVMWCALYVGEK